MAYRTITRNNSGGHLQDTDTGLVVALVVEDLGIGDTLLLEQSAGDHVLGPVARVGGVLSAEVARSTCPLRH